MPIGAEADLHHLSRASELLSQILAPFIHFPFISFFSSQLLSTRVFPSPVEVSRTAAHSPLSRNGFASRSETLARDWRALARKTGQHCLPSLAMFFPVQGTPSPCCTRTLAPALGNTAWVTKRSRSRPSMSSWTRTATASPLRLWTESRKSAHSRRVSCLPPGAAPCVRERGQHSRTSTFVRCRSWGLWVCRLQGLASGFYGQHCLQT